MRRHCVRSDLWLIVDGSVYDVSDFVDEHPGGLDALLKAPGTDVTAAFHGPQHPEKVHQLIGEYYIGRLKPEQQQQQQQQGVQPVTVAADVTAAVTAPPSGGAAASEGADVAATRRQRSRKE